MIGCLAPVSAKVYRDKVEANWLMGNAHFWYRVDLVNGEREFVLVDTKKGISRPAFDHALVRQLLKKDIPFDELEFSEDQKKITLISGKKQWLFNQEKKQVQQLEDETNEEAGKKEDEKWHETSIDQYIVPDPSSTSPDGSVEIKVKNHNLWLKSKDSKESVQLSAVGTKENSFHRDAIYARCVEMNYDKEDYPEDEAEVYWSADGKYCLAMQTTVIKEKRVYLDKSLDTSSEEALKLSYPYFKPGDHIPEQTPHLFDIVNKKEIPIDIKLFAQPWKISVVGWNKKLNEVYLLYNRRGHQLIRVYAIKLDSGKVETLIEERSSTFIDYAYKTFFRFYESSGEVIWMSERDGWTHLYLYDIKTRSIKNKITSGPWLVQYIYGVDEEKREILFSYSGYHEKQNPYQRHYARINWDGKNFVPLTEGDGHHLISFSPDKSTYINQYSRPDLAPIHELRRSSDGKLLTVLETSIVVRKERDLPERFVAPGRDGKTLIHGVIHKPKGFDPKKKYPVVENIYAGPHGHFAPIHFRDHYGHQYGIADRGMIVVQLDGMGTNGRGKTFHDVSWKNIKDAGFPDRIAWMKAAAKNRPWMDLSRVGVYGGSAGGQNAMRAVLDFADFYKAAAADCGCHDNRLDKIWWNEAWMGWPVDVSYKLSSNIDDAHKLAGKLLLTLGEHDRNVDPISTFNTVEALKRAEKEFEFHLIPKADHGAGESTAARKLRADFFEKHLLNSKS